jgi:GNAT superfamily N-acetyltransferase
LPPIEIRPTSPTDLSSLFAIQHSYQTAFVWQMDRSLDERHVSAIFREIRLPRPVHVEYPRPLDYFSAEALQTSTCLSALLAGNAIGYVRLKEHLAPKTVWVTDFAVREDLRRQGIACAMVLAVQDWAVEHGHRRVIIEVQSKNIPAMRLALKLG